ncbi:hypothetical protein I3500192B8_07310 [Acidaminococcus intestini]|uniref:ChaN family lipoprotein n=1 Tax=Acidaminococcus intestini TaxID=187327 RepID=UPI0036F40A6C
MKRKWMMVLGLLPLLMGIPPSHHLDAAPGLYLSKAGMALPAGTVAQEASQSGIIFFGEEHTNALSHKREFELLTELYRLVPDRLVLSLEMLEKDVQASLDAYLAGRMTEMEFLKVSRPWPNYERDYRHLVEFAKKKGLPVLAANVPRRVASHVVQHGSTTGLVLEDAQYLPKDLEPLTGEYREKFRRVMKQNAGVMPLGTTRKEAFYKAQCIKDAVMAEALMTYLDAHPDAVMFHVTGSFHMEDGLGTAAYVRKHRPGVRLYLVSPQHEGQPKDKTSTLHEVYYDLK